jgi:hypothetical protein
MQDILLDETGDLAIDNGDLLIGNSAVQHLDLLLQSNKGDWKENPLVGIDLIKKLNSSINKQNADGLKKQIKLQMEMDGFTGIKINGTIEDIEIIANEI